MGAAIASLFPCRQISRNVSYLHATGFILAEGFSCAAQGGLRCVCINKFWAPKRSPRAVLMRVQSPANAAAGANRRAANSSSLF
jgi:hypothetical protein